MQSEAHAASSWVPSGIAGLFERPGVYFLALDLDGRIIESNSTWQARFGAGATCDTPRTLADFVAPESRATVTEVLERLRSGITVPGVELVLIPCDGDPFLVTGMISPVLEGGDVASAFGVLREQGPSNFKLRDAVEPAVDRRFLEALVEHAPSSMFLTDERQEIVAWNRNFLELWGLDASVVQAGHARSAALRIVADPDAFAATLAELAEDREQTARGSLRLTDGRVIDWSSTPTRDRNGKYIGRASYHTDATVRAETEARLERSQAFYRQLAASFPDGGVFIFDSKLTFVIADGQGLSDIGLSKATVEGRALQELVPARIAKELLPLFTAALDGERGSVDVRFFRRTFNLTVVPLDFGAAPGGRHAMAIARDVTKRKQLQDQLSRAEARLRTLVEQIPAVTYVQQVHPSGNETIYISPQVERIFGYSPDELLDGSVAWYETIHPEDRERIIQATDAANVAGEGFMMEYRAVRRDGSVRWVRDSATVITDERGRAKFWQGILVDITDERRLELALRESESLFRSAFDDAPTGIVLIGLDGQPKRVNRAFCDMLGYPEEHLLRPRTISSLTHPDDTEDGRRAFRRIVNREIDRYRISKRFIRRDGELVWTDMDVSLAFDDDGEPEYLVAHFQDVTEQHRLEEQVRRSEAVFRMTFDHAAIGMARVAPDGRCLDANPSLCQMFGYSREELLAIDVQTITHPDDLDRDLEYARQVLDGSIDTYTTEKRYFHKNGDIVWGELNVSLVRDEGGEPLFFISQIQNITQKKDLESRLEHMAHHDGLTGVLNRHGLSRAIAAARVDADDERIAILMLDMDDFKDINDAYGHVLGDTALREVAARIRACLRGGDIVARLGGDEFMVVLAGPIDCRLAQSVAKRIRTAIEEPIQLAPQILPVQVRVSIGIEIGARAQAEVELMRAADDAMYDDKRGRKVA